jgi:PAS domain S-box-containing protein
MPRAVKKAIARYISHSNNGMLQEKETMPEKNILIADDDQEILDILKEMIQREGYRVFLASNGKEAVEAIKINPIDLAILDIKMPVMDGIEALKEIKKIDQGIEVLIMTGYADLETLKQAVSYHGAFDYILKPFKRADILNGIQNALLKRDFASQKKLREKELEERILQLEKQFHESTHRLRESQIKYRDIVEKSNDAIVVVQDGKLKFANTKTVELTGYPQEDLKDMSFLEMVHPEDRDMVAESYKSEDFPNIFSFRALRKSGESLWVEINTVRTTWEKRQATLNVIRDISERKKAEEALRHSSEQLLKEHDQRKTLSKRLIDLLEKDRHQIAMELHDDIGQIMTSLKMDLEMIHPQLRATNTKLESQIRAAEEKTVQVIRGIKDISRGLKPGILGTLGLVPSLRELFNEIQRQSNIVIKYFSRNIPKRFDPEKELAIYRIAQEALTNIIKYAQAKNVFVNLVEKDGVLTLGIEDDGVGFDQDKVATFSIKRGALGLLIMRERATQFNGEFSIESKIGKGTHLLVEIPF